jgi:hypothetical protein
MNNYINIVQGRNFEVMSGKLNRINYANFCSFSCLQSIDWSMGKKVDVVDNIFEKHF